MDQQEFLELKSEIITLKSTQERIGERIDTVIGTCDKLSRNFEKITNMVVNIAQLETKNSELDKRLGKIEGHISKIVMTILSVLIVAVIGLVLK